MLPIPPFDDPFLESVAESLRKRSKALKHRSQSFDVYKVYELIDGKMGERLEARLEGVTAEEDAVLKMQIWQNRWVELEARSPDRKKRVSWVWTYDGRLAGNISGRAMIAAFEQTFDLKFDMNAARTVEFTAIWKPLLAKGPVEVR